MNNEIYLKIYLSVASIGFLAIVTLMAWGVFDITKASYESVMEERAHVYKYKIIAGEGASCDKVDVEEIQGRKVVVRAGCYVKTPYIVRFDDILIPL